MKADNTGCACATNYNPVYNKDTATTCKEFCASGGTWDDTKKCECKTDFISSDCSIACSWANAKGKIADKAAAALLTACECADTFYTADCSKECKTSDN